MANDKSIKAIDKKFKFKSSVVKQVTSALKAQSALGAVTFDEAAQKAVRDNNKAKIEAAAAEPEVGGNIELFKATIGEGKAIKGEEWTIYKWENPEAACLIAL